MARQKNTSAQRAVKLLKPAELGAGSVEQAKDGTLLFVPAPAAIDQLARLDSTTRIVLEAFAIEQRPIRRDELRDVLNDPRRPLVSPSKVSRAVTTLVGLGMVEVHGDGRGGYRVADYWRDVATWSAIEHNRFQQLVPLLQNSRPRHYRYDRESLLYRDLRIAMIRGDSHLFDRWRGELLRGYFFRGEDPIIKFWNGGAPAALPFAGIVHPSFLAGWIRAVTSRAVVDWRMSRGLRLCLRAIMETDDDPSPWQYRLRCLDALMCDGDDPSLPSEPRLLSRGKRRGKRDRKAATTSSPAAEAVCIALRQLLNGGDNHVVASMFDAARMQWRREVGSRKPELPGVMALFHALALLGAERIKPMQQLCGRVQRSSSFLADGPAFERLERLHQLPTGEAWHPSASAHYGPSDEDWFDDEDDEDFDDEDDEDVNDEDVEPARQHRTRGFVPHLELRDPHRLPANPWDRWLCLMLVLWQDGPCKHPGCKEACEQLAAQADAAGWGWLAEQCRGLAQELMGEVPSSELWRVTSLARYRPTWERSLTALREAAAALAKERSDVENVERVTFRVAVIETTLMIEPYLQKKRKRGWTKGRRLSLSKMATGGEQPWCTASELTIMGHIKLDNRYGSRTHYFDNRAALGLIGHPLVFRNDVPEKTVAMVRRRPSVRARQDGAELVLDLVPSWSGKGVYVCEETPDRIAVYEGTKQFEAVAAALGPKGLAVPAEGVEAAKETLAVVAAAVNVHGDDAAFDDDALPAVAPDGRLYLELKRDGDGVRLSAQSRPFGPEGPALAPGSGSPVLVGEVDGARVRTSRDLTAERSAFDALVNATGVLAGWSSPSQPFYCRTLEESMEMLSVIQPLALDDNLVVSWEERQGLSFVGEIDASAVRANMRSADEWLALSGDVVIDDKKVASFRDLFFGAERVGRFVQLSDGQFVALTERMRRELAALEAFAISTKGNTVRLHPAAALALTDVGEGFGSFKPDKAARLRLEDARAALTLDPPVPSTFDGELRPYQRDGFRWLCRLATLGLGACLADDMGLGKTIQILALFLHRAAKGPALIVAPTSVCGNWVREARRFAPTLNMVSLRESDRDTVFDKLGPQDVLVASYGLLAREIDRLAARRFDVVVLDEAQAIKNPRSQRAAAAFQLQAHARVVATGTPVQNRLSELFSIFRFLVPGLLGNMKSFNDQFARPIEKEQDREALDRLRRRTSPFLLRRTKGEVLDDLPPRTDITLRIEADEEEAAFYEAIRRRAAEKLELQRELGPQQVRFVILAELTKLRRACCHPSLVKPPAGKPPPQLSGAKLDALVALLTELIDNRHRALVFSQFVDVLTLVRGRLDEAGISYEYLDGSTPAKKRDERVAAFQAGRSDAFLISTKAGGFGLNLTGADYVVHVDPWWNPAVEDQASDRVHRIGQRRPVTVYRLVMANTIEESILEMHHSKRELANALLADTDAPPVLDVDELVMLLAGD